MSSVASSIQTLLHAVSDSKDAFSLAKQASMAANLLTRSPGLFAVALNVLASAYQFHILPSELQLSCTEKPLLSALQEAEAVMHSLLEYAPHIWCYRILQWCVDVGSSVSTGQTSTCKNLEEILHFWLQQPKLKPVLQFLDTCTHYLVTSGREDECVDVLVKECLGSSPELNWLMTHVLSLQPATLLPKFLERVLQLPLRPDSSAFSSVGQSLEFLGHTHRAVVGESVVSVVGKVVRGEVGEGEKWSRQVELLLRLGPLCEGVLSLTSQDCLKLVTADKMKALVLAGSASGEGPQKSLDSSDEDEGEVRSDDEGKPPRNTNSGGVDVEGAAVELLGVMEKEAAATAISQLVHTYSCLADVAQSQEEAMEEGEIQNVSLVTVVQEGCRTVLENLLHQLQTAAVGSLVPVPQLNRGTEREFVVGLHCGLQEWSLLILEPDMYDKCRGWLCAAVSSVSVCSAELQAAQALASMLLHCQDPDHLVYVLRVYREVTLRHSSLAGSVLAAALGACREGTEPHHLCKNLWRITVAMDMGVEVETQRKFVSALRLSLLPLSDLLRRLVEGGRDMCSAWRVLQMMGKVGGLEGSGGEYSTHCKILTNLLVSFDSLSTLTGMVSELCVGQCVALLARWADYHSSLKTFLLRSALRKAVAESGSTHSAVPSERQGRHLLFHQLPSATAGASRSGPSLRCYNHSHSTNDLIGLLELVARGNGDLVMSLLVDEVAPHLPSDSAPWLPGEGPRSTSLEWLGNHNMSLSVKQNFDRHPLFWHLLLFSTHSGCGFCQCEPIVCSLLLVLTQHWFSCRCSVGVASGRELHSSEWLVESLAAAGWLPPPLSHCAELFRSISPNDLYLLMGAISNFFKVNLQELRKGARAQLKEGDCWMVLKGVLVRNIHKLGNVYAHYQ